MRYTAILTIPSSAVTLLPVNRSRVLSQATQWFWLIAGSVLSALAYDLFLIPHSIVPGGAGGVAMVLNRLVHLPVGATVIVLNVPLFLLGVWKLGRTYGAKSVLGMALSSLLIDFFAYVVPLRPATDNPVLASIFGGLTLGVGLGLVFRGGGSTGGSDIVGMVLNRTTNLSTGTAILLIDALVISAAGVAFHSFELALYGYLNLYLSTRAIDLVLEGLSYTRALFVVSDRPEAIAAAVTQQLNRGATVLAATGAFSGIERGLVFSVMSRREIVRARDIIRETDPGAFVVITDVYEVLGEGFRPRT